MEIIEIKKKYLGLDKDELEQLKMIVLKHYNGVCPKIDIEKLETFAKYMIHKLEELEK